MTIRQAGVKTRVSDKQTNLRRANAKSMVKKRKTQTRSARWHDTKK